MRIFERVLKSVFETVFDRVFERVFGRVFERVFERDFERDFERVFGEGFREDAGHMATSCCFLFKEVSNEIQIVLASERAFKYHSLINMLSS